MRILVDTHVFLWAFLEPKKLPIGAKNFFTNSLDNEFYLSHVSAWEISIKFGNNKLILPDVPEVFIQDRARLARFMHLQIRLEHVTQVHSLPPIHRDPFDRLLISQARIEGLTILTSNQHFAKYKIDMLNVSDL